MNIQLFIDRVESLHPINEYSLKFQLFQYFSNSACMAKNWNLYKLGTVTSLFGRWSESLQKYIITNIYYYKNILIQKYIITKIYYYKNILLQKYSKKKIYIYYYKNILLQKIYYL